MTDSEFKVWWEFHRTRHNRFYEWSKGLSKSERERLLKTFRFQIVALPYRLAKACSLRMLNRGDFEDGPKGWERHGEILADLAPNLSAESFSAANKSTGGADQRERQRRERAGLEERFGRILDAMGIDEVLELAGGIKDIGVRISTRRLLANDRFPKGQKNQMIRPILLRVLSERETPPDPFAALGLGETPDFSGIGIRSNDQWE